MAIEHFSHKHLLVLNEGIENKDDDDSGREEVFCDACWKPIIKEGGCAYYSCSESDGCEFFLHKTCAELPREIKHPMHPEHSLTLFAVPPYASESSGCDICRSVSRGFTYNCSVCEYDVEVECAFEDCSFRHQSHDHNLTLLQRPAIFHCDACDRVAEDLSYHCTECPFWIHKSCASSPATIEPTFHSHPLTLSYSIPDKYRTIWQYCNICKERLNPCNWLYMCAGCTIFIHINCATYAPTVLRDGEIRRFVESLRPEAADRIEAVRDELYHWSHEDHPLILFENLQLQSKDGNEMKGSEEMLICDGCVKSIDAEEEPFYACLECSFFLHKICAALPRELRHDSLQLLKPVCTPTFRFAPPFSGLHLILYD